MEAALKKYFWLFKLGGIAIAVMFAASAGVNMAVSKLALDPAGEAIPEAEEPEDEEAEQDNIRAQQANTMNRLAGNTTKSRKSGVASFLVGSNIFCPTCAPAPEEQPATASTGFGGPVRPGEVKSQLPLMLLATMESDDPAYSMATILHTDSNSLSAYSPNDQVRAGVVVSRVERGRVVFRNGAQMEYIELGGEPPAQPKAPTKPIEIKKEPKAPAKNSREIPGASEAISCDSEFASCTVDRAFVEKLLSNPAQLTKQARIVPAVRDGETKGYKFYGIRPGSLPKLLGIKNGDLLTSVNGHQLESLDQAMDLYNKLRRASHLSVTIERKGQQVSKEIDIK